MATTPITVGDRVQWSIHEAGEEPIVLSGIVKHVSKSHDFAIIRVGVDLRRVTGLHRLTRINARQK